MTTPKNPTGPPLSASIDIHRSATTTATTTTINTTTTSKPLPTFLHNTIQGITSNTSQLLNSSRDSLKTFLLYLSQVLKNPILQKKEEPDSSSSSSLTPSLTSTIQTPTSFRKVMKNKEKEEVPLPPSALSPEIKDMHPAAVTYHDQIIHLVRELQRTKFWNIKLSSSSSPKAPYQSWVIPKRRDGPFSSSCSNRVRTITTTPTTNNDSEIMSEDQQFEIPYIFIYKKKARTRTNRQKKVKIQESHEDTKGRIVSDIVNTWDCESTTSDDTLENDYLAALAFVTHSQGPPKIEHDDTHFDNPQELLSPIIPHPKHETFISRDGGEQESYAGIDEFSSLLQVYFGLDETKS